MSSSAAASARTRVQDADALAERLTTRRDSLTEQLGRLEEEGRALAESLAERGASVAQAREQLGVAEHAHEAAREARTAAQVDEAQSQARVQVAHDRERRLAEEHQSASQRLEALRAELSELSQADSALAEQMASWQLDLETRGHAGRRRDATRQRRSRRAHGGRDAH